MSRTLPPRCRGLVVVVALAQAAALPARADAAAESAPSTPPPASASAPTAPPPEPGVTSGGMPAALPLLVSGVAVGSLGLAYLVAGVVVGAGGLVGSLATPRWSSGAPRPFPGEPVDLAQARILVALGALLTGPLVFALGVAPTVLGGGLVSAAAVVLRRPARAPEAPGAAVPVPALAPSAPVPADTDTDSDASPDTVDRCPREPGPVNNRGCPWPDTDGDGTHDGADRCAAEPGAADNGGCPWGDADGDAVTDNVDRCPAERGAPDNQGCPAGDRDKDGLADGIDRCPDQAGPADNGGCARAEGAALPQQAPPAMDPRCADATRLLVVIRGDTVEIPAKIQFETGTATMLAASRAVVEQVLLTLQCRPDIRRLALHGHTDASGSEATNTRLSLDRATAVRDFLVAQGVAPDRLQTFGHGATRPLASDADEKGREMNRRVEFVIVEMPR
ncbi:MAG: OmpA family protein [Deltaproteobacteria bacterium]|nr:OmpA family protein [Deltaproteobacteria bacterium]